jgi:hypothetical protein
MTSKHRLTREGDENVCSCGLRWDIDEPDPHPMHDWETPDLSTCSKCGDKDWMADQYCSESKVGRDTLNRLKKELEQ